MKTLFILAATAVLSSVVFSAPMNDKSQHKLAEMNLPKTMMKKLFQDPTDHFLKRAVETQVIGDQRELKKDLEHFFGRTTSEDSISSYEANFLKFEVRFEELGSGAFGVENILEAAKTLIKTLKNATETIISFQGCDYPGTELVNEAILINLGIQALADYNEKPDPVRGKMISTFQSELNSLVQNEEPKEKMLLGLQSMFKDHTESAKRKLEALSGKEIKPEKKTCPLI